MRTMADGIGQGKEGNFDIPPDDSRLDDLNISEFLKHGFRTTPTEAEASLIERIETSVSEKLDGLFRRTDRVLERFGMVSYVTRDEGDGPRAVQGADGEYLRDWNRLTADDMESAIWDLSEAIRDVSMIVAQSYMESQLAYENWHDTYSSNYMKASGTKDDKAATARIKSRDERYYYFYCFYFHRMVKSKLDGYEKSLNILEFWPKKQLRSR